MMAGDLNNHAPFAGGHGDGGLAMGGKPHDQAHDTTNTRGAQDPSLADLDFAALAGQSIVTPADRGNGSGPHDQAQGLDQTFTGPAIWRNATHDEPVTVAGFTGQHDGRLFFAIAESKTAIPGDELTPQPTAQAIPSTAQPTPDKPEHYTDLGNAYRLVRVHGQDLRHVPGWGWLSWDGQRWQRDEKAPMLCAKSIALGFYQDAKDLQAKAQEHLEAAKRAATAGDTTAEAIAQERFKELQGKAAAAVSWAKASQARGKLEAAVKLAESESAVSAEADQFDADPWLFNCANGILDLRSGILRPHNRSDLFTTLAPVAYDPAATCPTWDAFLARIMRDSSELIGFLQRLIGYSLTGSVREQMIFFLYGSGANGKSVFLRTILAMLGRDYAKQAAPDVLIESRDRHPTEVADLAGVRFVASIEVSEGKRLAENLVKQMTGGDPMKARLMRQDFFQFDPQFKICLAANHKPVVKGTDFAIWRRIKLIPFEVTIPEAEQDKTLGDKLLAELPGILAWAVRGCLAWQREGLGIPPAVVDATAAYRAESDELAPFLEECCNQGEKLQAQAGPLFKAYQAWAEANGILTRDQLTNVKFGRQLQERGFDKYKDPSSRQTFYTGLELVQKPPEKPAASSRE